MHRRVSDRRFTAAELVGDPVISAVQRLLADQPDGVWCGSFDDAYAALSARTSEATRRDNTFWPQNPQALSRRLRRMSEGLRENGVVLTTRRGSDRASVCLAKVATKAAA